MRKLIKKDNKTLNKAIGSCSKILCDILISSMYYSFFKQSGILKTNNVLFEVLAFTGITIVVSFLTTGIFETPLKEKKEDQKC